MEQQDQRLNAIKVLHQSMTRILRAVQVTPFVYSVVYVIVFAIYNFVGEQVQDYLDLLFYVSPLMVLFFLIYSYILHLCKWHKIVCVLPTIPQIVDLVDGHYEFTQYEIMGVNATTIILSVVLIISAYKVFLDGQKRN